MDIPLWAKLTLSAIFLIWALAWCLWTVGPDHGACGTVPDMPPGAFIWPAGAPAAYTAP